MTYQFATTAQPDDMPGGRSYEGWTPFTSAEKGAVRDALDHIETFLNIEFVEVTGSDDPDINIGHTDLQTPQEDPSQTLGDWIAGHGGNYISWNMFGITRWDGYALYDTEIDLTDNKAHLILHEIGHALGLSHPFNTGTLDEEYENIHYSVMSYTPDPHTVDIPGVWGDNDTMMLFDIFALQSIWGAADYKVGNTTYTGRGDADVRVIWDSGGTDTLDASGNSKAVTLELRAGEFSTFGDYEDVTIAFGTVIENANGSAFGDTIHGNDGANRLSGRGGSDTIHGGGGRDVVRGQAGHDKLYGDSGADRLKGGGGKDTLYGGDGRDKLKGGGGRDILYGGEGRDKLDGGRGTDKLFGGADKDVFLFRAGNDRDIIRDFDDTDIIKVVGYGDRDEVLSHAEERGHNVRFDFGGGDILTVQNVTLDDIEDHLLAII